ncbi:uncharacterized protein HMPREF1541_02482 [Cyphellophora europaea CBS 101466]|uniref:Uncharacterized protein n=1 Tax=Cyphellophora europaea (strain CBS 101466) TaxID=1220924 RepID=W2S5J7_CYPE1|nr:uncharacterized protein HMPREF1541_02482 [Cyphellophora europaea CBS 101466]ETN43323.1 hypothetical protein HMPREF1541_02482 [Cyphellophora europaea CBS 101466]
MDDPYDFDKAWDDVLEAFERTSRIKLQPGVVLTTENVIQQLKLKRDHDAEASRKYQGLKRTLSRTLECIRTLGFVASKDQSGLLGPSNLVFTAIVLLIQAGDSYRNIFDNLDDLFEESSDVLERFDIYRKMEEVDSPLKKVVHELLQTMLSICALSIKVLNGNRLVKYLKALAFNDDEGVKAELIKLRKLVERETSMNAALTYRHVKEGFEGASEGLSGVRSAVDRIADDLSRRESESVENKQMELIKNTLGTQPDVDRQLEIYKRHRSEVVPGTGKWLQETEMFQQWADSTRTSSNLVLLSGDQGYGKSFLSTTVIHELQTHSSRAATFEKTSRTSVGYYFLQSRGRKGMHGIDDEGISIDRVLKTLASQLAQDPVYRKNLALSCESWIEPDNVEELCSCLLDFCYKSTDVFFLVIDGLDHADERASKMLASILKTVYTRYSPRQRSRVRIMLTGRVKTVQDLVQRMPELGPTMVNLDLAAQTGTDVALFVQDRLDNMSLLEGSSDSVKKLRQEVFSTLTTNVKGDFVHAGLLLKEISTKQWPAEIREVLASAQHGGQRSDTIAREVTRCDSTLSAQQIRDLNVLLLWVMSARQTLTIDELEATLFLSNRESSLRSLRDQIHEKYSTFFHLDETLSSTRVSLSSDSIRQYFAEASRHEQLAVLTSSRIQEVEVKIVKRFLSSVCDEELYAKFDFDDFFSRKLNFTAASVHVNLETAGASLLSGCLQALTSPEKETAELVDYAATHFPKHMAEVDLSMTSPVAKTDCGRLLLLLFTDQEAIGRWWDLQRLEKQTDWFFADDNVDISLSFFRDTAITRTFGEEHMRWVKSLMSKSSPDSDLLGEVVKYLARHLLTATDDIPDIRLLFSCLNAYRTMLMQRRDPAVQRTAELKNYQVSSEVIVEVFTWIAATLGDVDEGKSYEWNRALAAMFSEFNHNDAAIAQYQLTIPLSDDGWSCRWGLGIALREREEYDAALEVLADVERRIIDGSAKENSPKKWLRNIRQLMGWCYRQLGRYDEALAIYDKHIRESREKGLTDYGFTFDKIRVFYYREEFSSVVEILRSLRNSIDPNFGIQRSSRLLHWLCDDSDFDSILVETSKATKTRDYLRRLFTEAIDDTYHPSYLAKNPEERARYRVNMKLYLSMEMWRRAHTEEEEDDVIMCWEELTQEARAIDKADMIIAQLTKRLATVYLQRMREYTLESADAQSLLKKAMDLVVEDTSQQDAWASSVSPVLLYARHLSVLGRSDQARRLSRGSVKVALDLLTDEDPENDWEAYLRLAYVLMYCGDDEGALAAWSFFMPLHVSNRSKSAGGAPGYESPQASVLASQNATNTTDHAKVACLVVEEASTDDGDPVEPISESKTNGSASTTDKGATTDAKWWQKGWEGDLDYGCDGYCGVDWAYSDDMYVCKDCLDVMFCKDCIQKLRVGSLEDNVCNPKHRFLHVPPFDMNEAQLRGKDYLRVKAEKVPIAQWLSQVRKDWELEDNDTQSDH